MRTISLNEPDWAYLNVELLSDEGPVKQNVDQITWKMILEKAMKRFLGLAGYTIPIDIIHGVDSKVWLRVPVSDLDAIWSGLSGFGTTTALDDTAVDVSIRIVRASRSIMGMVGESRDQWLS
ncbi:ribonucleases P/MRP protein subunit Pop8p [Trichomonascus vanleenenianus]|uniref:ribonuclease P n=1 Tax=Trichomonascus vanleenenianus TaxID=2268995 RepID=UPI003EC9BB0B